MLEEIVKGFFCDPEYVAVVKATGDESCAVFTAGQSAVDGGFHLPYPAEQVAQEVNDLIEELYAEPDEGDEEEDENGEEDGRE